MPVHVEADVRAALDRGEVAPVYLLVGDDEVGKTALLDALGAVVEPDLQAFNLERLYLNEQPVEEAVAAARTLPLLGGRRVVIALRSEAVLKPKGRGAAEDDDMAPDETTAGGGEGSGTGATAELERYVASPVAENCLVLVAADMARNTRVAKQLLKTAVVVEFWGLKSDRAAAGREVADALRAAERFVKDRAREAGLSIRPGAIQPLLEHAGTDISTLRNDVERLVTYCIGRAEITLADVRAVVAGEVQINEWALTDAIKESNAKEALRQLELALEAGHSPWKVLGQLAWFVRARLVEHAPQRVALAVEALLRADTALKSSGGDPQVVLERLVIELCGSDTRRAGAARRKPSR